MALRSETKLWWAQSRRDFRIAERSHENRLYEAAVFFCEQAVQKGLKALVIQRTGRMPPKIHSLVELGRLVGVDRTMRDFLADLTPHYMLTRYPDVAGALTTDLYDGHTSLRFLRGTRKVMDWCRQRLR